MKNSRRMNRMGRAAKRAKRQPGFNLVSLMDIFTILVFFLLVNSSNTEQLPSPEKVELPESISENKPDETAIVMVTDAEILVQGKAVALISDVLASDSPVIPVIREELAKVANRLVRVSEKGEAEKKRVTIMGDRKIPFKLLKKIMTSCTFAGYETIYLAVVQKASQFSKDE